MSTLCAAGPPWRATCKDSINPVRGASTHQGETGEGHVEKIVDKEAEFIAHNWCARR
jgi:hypothetical protein